MKPQIRSGDLAKKGAAVFEYNGKAITIIELEIVSHIHIKQANETITITNSEDGEWNVVTVHEENSCSGVKLKLFQLEKFDGNFESWLPFWELFKQAIDE